MRIKVCGMRQAQNLKDLSNLNPDYIGFIFYDKSKRFVTDFPKVTIDSSIKKVGVFVNESIANVLKTVHDHKLNVVQLHGDESFEYCEELKGLLAERSRSDNKLNNDGISTRLNQHIEIIIAFSVDENFNFSKTKEYESSCNLFLFDTKGKEYGGNGVKYDWSILENYKGNMPFLLSGGIAYSDLDAVLKFRHSKCIGLDLNSGFEDEPGIKNIEKLKRFFKEVKE